MSSTTDSKFRVAFSHTIKLEGGYSDDPDDPGGETNLGITRRTARRGGYKGDMRSLTIEQAEEIYLNLYWKSKYLPLEKIAAWDLLLAIELFDSGVNCGVRTAAKFLQRAINVLREIPIKVDGWAGSGTLKALKTSERDIRKRNIAKLCNHFQISYYIAISKKKTKLKKFLSGWLDKRG